MIPLLHDFSNETVLVFGGGPVGARKARRFAREAAVVVISPAFVDELIEAAGSDPSTNSDSDSSADSSDNPSPDSDGDPSPDSADDPFAEADRAGSVELIRAAPDPGAVPAWLERTDPALTVAATDDGAINDAVVEAARERCVLVNRADRAGERERGSVVVPATVRDGDVVVSISTGGGAPALSKYLRQEFEERLDGTSEMATLLSNLRSTLKARDVPRERRREVVTDVVNSSAVWTTLRTGTPNYERVIEDVLGEMGEASSGGERP